MRNIDLVKIGQRIKATRLENKLSQDKFGEHIGLQQSAVSDMENGHRLPTTEQLTAIFERFGKGADWLLYGVEHKLEYKMPPLPGGVCKEQEGPTWTGITPEEEKMLEAVRALPDVRDGMLAMLKLSPGKLKIKVGEMIEETEKEK